MKLLEKFIEKEVNLYLNEKQFKGFSMKKFKSLDNIVDKLNYANKHLHKYELGMGDNRLVYNIGSGKVLKILRNPSMGFFNNQNIKEIDIWNKIKDEKLVPRIYDYDKSGDPKWIVAEMVKPIGDEHKKYFDMEPLHVSVFLNDIFEGKSFEEAVNDLKKYGATLNDKDLELLQKAHILESKYNIIDLKFENWGIDTSGELLLLDSGV